MRDKIADVLWGLILITIGLLIGGKALGWIEVSLYFPGWWCLFLIIPCMLGIIKHGFHVLDVGGLLLGIAILLQQNGYVDRELLEQLFLPAVFLLIGFSILCKALFASSGKKYTGQNVYMAVFSGNTSVAAGRFDGCRAEAAFGGLEVRLTEAEIQNGAVIDATAVFGGIDLIVPEGVTVKFYHTSIFGKAKNRKRSGNENEPVIIVNALCVFGGVEVK